MLAPWVTASNAPGTGVANRFYAMMDKYLSRLDALGCVVALTAAGRELQKRFASIYAGCQRRLLDTMTPEEADEFLKLLCKFVKVPHRPYFTATKDRPRVTERRRASAVR